MFDTEADTGCLIFLNIGCEPFGFSCFTGDDKTAFGGDGY